MKVSTILSLLTLPLLSTNVMAQQLEVPEMEFATYMDERQPVATDTLFSAGVGTLFCFTRITGATDTSEVTHEWYYKDEEKARIDLSVASDDWRTWSSKNILKRLDGTLAGDGIRFKWQGHQNQNICNRRFLMSL